MTTKKSPQYDAFPHSEYMIKASDTEQPYPRDFDMHHMPTSLNQKLSKTVYAV